MVGKLYLNKDFFLKANVDKQSAAGISETFKKHL